MSTVDDRIVSMQFDNAKFEQNMAATIRSLDKLRASLDFANQTRSLGDLSNAANRFDMSHMGMSIDGISSKFLAMATVGITALTNLTNRAVDAGINMAKSLTVTPIFQGYADYNTKLTSVKTIMNATGQDIKTVSGYFDELDAYADTTIYNLTDMTSAFAKFTNAGIDMKTAVPAIKGIANMVALAGQGAEAAQIAYYNLSQSLSGGFLTTIDYKSLNLANVATKEWKQQMIDGAIAAKTLKKEADGTYTTLGDQGGGTYNMMQLFTEGLKDQWATTKVLTDVLGKYGDKQTEIGKKAYSAAQDVKSLPMMLTTLRESVGTTWTDTFQIILGDVTESTKLFTGLTNAIQKPLSAFAKARNELLQGWKDKGGLTKFFDALQDSFWALVRPMIAIGRGFRDIFPPMTVDRLVQLTEGFARFVKHLYISNETMDKVRRVSAGLFAILEIGWTVVKELAAGIGDIIGALAPAGSGLLNFSATAGDMAVNLNKALVAGGAIHRFFLKIRDVIQNVSDYLQKLSDKIHEFFDTDPGGGAMEKSLGRIESRTKHIAGVWDKFNERMQGIYTVLGKVWDEIAKWFGELGSKIAAAFHPGDFHAAMDILNAGLLGGVLALLVKFYRNGLKLNFGGIFGKAAKTLDIFNGKLKAMQTEIKANVILKIAASVALLTASLVALALIDSAALTKALTATAVGMGELVGTMVLLDKGVGGLKGGAKLTLVTAAMIEMATALGIMTASIVVLSRLDPADLAKGIAGVGAALAIMVTATRLISTNATGLITATGAILGMSAALVALSGVVKIFSMMDPKELAKGLGSMAIALGELVGATLLLSSNPAGLIAGTAAIIGMSGALVLISGVVKIFSMMKPGELAKGLGAMAAGLLILVGATYLISTNASGLIAGAAAIVLLAGAVNVMAGAVLLLGQAGVDTLAKGVGALAGMLLVLALGVHAMNGALGGAAALVVVSGALLALTIVIERLAKLSIAQIVTSIAALAAVLAVLGLAASALSSTLPALFGMGAAIGLLGAGFALFGAGVMLVAKGFEILATSGAKGAKAIVEIIKVFITARYEIIKAFAEAIIGLAKTILKAAPLLIRLVEALLLQLLETIVKLAPNIAMAIYAIVLNALILIRALFPELMQTGFELLMMLLKGINDHMPEIVKSVAKIIVTFLTSLSDNLQKIIEAGANLIIQFLLGIGNKVTEIIAAGVWILDQILVGLANGVLTIGARITDIVIAILASIASNSTRIATAGADFVIAFLDGIADNGERVAAAVRTFLRRILTTISESIIEVADDIARVMVDFLNGMADVIRRAGPNIRKAGVNLASAILDGLSFGLSSKAGGVFGAIGNVVGGVVNTAKTVADIESPSKEFVKIGEYIVQGLADGLKSDAAETEASNLADRTIETFRRQLANLSTLDDIGDINPTITPVLDLSEVHKGIRDMNSVMRGSTITPVASFNTARAISSAANADKSNEEAIPVESGPTEINFNQTINAPKALSTNDIYRNTKSQLALAKEELKIK